MFPVREEPASRFESEQLMSQFKGHLAGKIVRPLGEDQPFWPTQAFD